jgi:hypothetical protein
MRFHADLEKWRVSQGVYQSQRGDDFGLFLIEGPCGKGLRVIASSGDASLGVDWEHVSVSTPSRCPNWTEMSFIKDLFWAETECVMQLHVPKSKHINTHNFCLHLWRPLNAEIPMPPSIAV